MKVKVILDTFLDWTSGLAIFFFVLYGIEAILVCTPLLGRPLYLAPDWPLFFTLFAAFGAPTFMHHTWMRRRNTTP